MQYGDIRFYLAALLVAEICTLVCCLFDGRMRMGLFRHPFLFQVGVLMLTVVSLYASDSNKPVQPRPPQQQSGRVIYMHRGQGGGRFYPINVRSKGADNE